MIVADFDRHEDVLYVSLGMPRSDYVVEGNGVLYAFGLSDNRPSGVTVVGFLSSWKGREFQLYRLIASFLNVPEAEMMGAVHTALFLNRPRAAG